MEGDGDPGQDRTIAQDGRHHPAEELVPRDDSTGLLVRAEVLRRQGRGAYVFGRSEEDHGIGRIVVQVVLVRWSGKSTFTSYDDFYEVLPYFTLIIEITSHVD